MFDSGHIAQLQEIIKNLYGLALGDNHLNELLISLKKRIKALGLNTLPEYLALISNGGKNRELDHLVSQITVGETSFLRTPQQFWALRDFVFPELIKQKIRTGIPHFRFLSAGCATGEEAYSLAMVALEAVKPYQKVDIEIVACDVNKDFLAEASEGLYPAKDMRTLDDYLKAKYFEPKDNKFQVRESLRSLVQFTHFNLARGDFNLLSRGRPFDAIFCRNVLIYFTQPSFMEALDHFYNVLEDSGYLFLGYSESLYGLDAKFDCIYVPGTFFYQKVTGERKPAPETVALPSPPKKEIDQPFRPRGLPGIRVNKELDRSPRPIERRVPGSGLTPELASVAELWRQSWDQFEREEYDQAREGFEKIIKEDAASPKGYLGIAFLLANQGENENSEECLRRCFEKDQLVPEGYYLRGLLAERREQWEEAINNYQRAIFLKSDFIIAHFNLASLYFRLAELRNAERELKVVREILAGEDEDIYLSGGWTRNSLLNWAESHLQKISELRI